MSQQNADANFARVATLRRDVADLAETLTDEQLDTPSLCGEWDVRTVIAHLAVLPTVSKLSFGATALRNRGNIDRTIDTLSRRLARTPIGDIATTLRDNADSRSTPPLMDSAAPRADLVAHSADIRIPVGLPFAPDPEDAEVTLGFLAAAPIGFMPRKRLAGLRLTGSTWTGPGARVTRSVAPRPTSSPRCSAAGSRWTGSTAPARPRSSRASEVPPQVPYMA